MRMAAVMIERHWANLRARFTHRITNAGAQAVHDQSQPAKQRARGFRSREHFRIAIYIHGGRLDLYPASTAAES